MRNKKTAPKFPFKVSEAANSLYRKSTFIQITFQLFQHSELQLHSA